MEAAFLVLAVVFLAFSNGANDNFKGVATLYGSGRLGFGRALSWATATTLCGSVAAMFLGAHLVASFSGKGLVPDQMVGEQAFVLPVAIGAAGTVFLATLGGVPISTTHALVGALVGAGLASGSGVDLTQLGGTFLLPLLLSPVVAMLSTLVLYRGLRSARRGLGIEQDSCVCVEAARPEVAMAEVFSITAPTPRIVHRTDCSARLTGRLVGLDAQHALDAAHLLSSGAIGFARGLNDTPKIVALLAVGGALGLHGTVFWVAVAMALGGLLAGRKVAHTVSHRITAMNDGQGFSANLVTAVLVLLASRFGLPVSTTHVSVGSLFGIGAATGKGRRAAILGIAAAWFITLPVAAGIAAAAALVLA